MSQSERHAGSTMGHAAFDELTVGYALDALEPGEEELLLAHLSGCERCQQALGEHRDVAAQLALGLVGDVAVFDRDVAPGAALQAAFASRPAGPDVSAGRSPYVPSGRQPLASETVTVRARPGLRPGRIRPLGRTGRRVLAGVGALGLAAALTLGTYDVRSGHGQAPSGQQAALEAIADRSAAVAHLTGRAGDAAASATAVVAAGHAWLVSAGLSATTENTRYVVWAERGFTATAVTSFASSGGSAPVVADLGTTTSAAPGNYAVTLEPVQSGGSLPQAPTSLPVLYETAGGRPTG